jgi:hypothetical protein
LLGKSRSAFARLPAFVLALAFTVGSSFGTAHDPRCPAHARGAAGEHAAVDAHAHHGSGGQNAAQGDGSEQCNCEGGACGLSAVSHAYLPALPELLVPWEFVDSFPPFRVAVRDVVSGEWIQPPGIGPPPSI